MSDTIFTNPESEIANLPSVGDVTFKPLEPNYHKSATLLWVLAFLAPCIPVALMWANVITFPDGKEWLEIMFSCMLFVWASVAILNVMELRKRGYAMRLHDILYKKGLVWQSVVAVPYSRVQHVETHRGPIARMVGLSELRIYTAASGASADLTIEGLKIKDASKLREAILSRAAAESPKENESSAQLSPQGTSAEGANQND